MNASFMSFLRAFAADWLNAMSGGLSVPLMIGGILWPNRPWGIALGVTGVAAFVFSAFRVWRHERSAVLAARAVTSARPNWRIHDAFFELRPDIIDDVDEEKWEEVGSKVLDLLSTNQVMAWGREIDRFSGRSPLQPIATEFWRGARFTYWFLKEDDPASIHVESNSGMGHNEYADVHFDRASLEAAWNG